MVKKHNLNNIKAISLLILMVFVTSCVSTVENEDTPIIEVAESSNHLDNSKLPENIEANSQLDQFIKFIKQEENAVYIVGVVGDRPLGYVKLCFENILENKRAFFERRFDTNVNNGGVAVASNLPDNGNVFLCQIGYGRYGPYIPSHSSANLIEVDGPGIYYLGTIDTSVSNQSTSGTYVPNIQPAVVEQLAKTIDIVKQKFPDTNLPLKNFDFNHVSKGEFIEMESMGNAMELLLQEHQKKNAIKG